MTTDDTKPISQYLKPLGDHKVLVIAVTIVTVALGVFASLAAPTKYTSTTTIVVYPISGDPTKALETDDSTVDMATELRIATSQAVMDVVKEKLVDQGIELSDAEIDDNVAASTTKESRILDISFTAGSSEVAQAGANAFADSYLEFRSSLANSNKLAAETTINGRIAVLQERLAEVSVRLAETDVASAAGVILAVEESSIQGELRAQQGALADLSTLTIDPTRVIDPADSPLYPDGLTFIQTIVGALAGGLVLGVVAAYVIAAFVSGNQQHNRRIADKQTPQLMDSLHGVINAIAGAAPTSDAHSPQQLAATSNHAGADQPTVSSTQAAAAAATRDSAKPPVSPTAASSASMAPSPSPQTTVPQQAAPRPAATPSVVVPNQSAPTQSVPIHAAPTQAAPAAVAAQPSATQAAAARAAIGQAGGSQLGGVESSVQPPAIAKAAVAQAAAAQAAISQAAQQTPAPAAQSQLTATPTRTATPTATTPTEAATPQPTASAQAPSAAPEPAASSPIPAALQAPKAAAEPAPGNDVPDNADDPDGSSSDEKSFLNGTDEQAASTPAGSGSETDGDFGSAGKSQSEPTRDSETSSEVGSVSDPEPDETLLTVAEANALGGQSPALADADRLIAKEGMDDLIDRLQGLGTLGPVAALSTGDSGGASALAVAFELAGELQGLGARVLLIDAAIDQPLLHSLIRVDPRPGLAEVLSGATPLSRAVRPLAGIEGLDTLTVGSIGGASAETVTGPQFDRLMAEAKTAYHLILVVGGSVYDNETIPALAQTTDGIILGTGQGVGEEARPELSHRLASLSVPTLDLISAVSATARLQDAIATAPSM